jgi:hypothetical protein
MMTAAALFISMGVSANWCWASAAAGGLACQVGPNLLPANFPCLSPHLPTSCPRPPAAVIGTESARVTLIWSRQPGLSDSTHKAAHIAATRERGRRRKRGARRGQRRRQDGGAERESACNLSRHPRGAGTRSYAGLRAPRNWARQPQRQRDAEMSTQQPPATGRARRSGARGKGGAAEGREGTDRPPLAGGRLPPNVQAESGMQHSYAQHGSTPADEKGRWCKESSCPVVESGSSVPIITAQLKQQTHDMPRRPADRRVACARAPVATPARTGAARLPAPRACLRLCCLGSQARPGRRGGWVARPTQPKPPRAIMGMGRRALARAAGWRLEGRVCTTERVRRSIGDGAAGGDGWCRSRPNATVRLCVLRIDRSGVEAHGGGPERWAAAGRGFRVLRRRRGLGCSAAAHGPVCRVFVWSVIWWAVAGRSVC